MTNLAAIISKYCKLEAPARLPNFETQLTQFLQYVGIVREFKEQAESLEAIPSKVLDVPAYLGIEAEVENVHRTLSLPDFWSIKTDGSLREGGMEFTTVPLPPKQSMQAVLLLWIVLFKLIKEGGPEFSWRTSNHVHLNVQELVEEEFKKLLLLVSATEPLLFSWVGRDRLDSNFCVPLTQSTSFNNINNYLRGKISLMDLATSWPKYTAVNLCRMFTFPYSPINDPVPNQHPALGTMEFRHLGGTPNVKDLFAWQSLIVMLFRASVQMSLGDLEKQIKGVTTLLKYQDLLSDVFSPSIAGSMKEYPDREVARVKELFLTPPKLVPVKATSAMAVYLTRLVDRQKEKPKEKKLKRPEGISHFDATQWTVTEL